MQRSIFMDCRLGQVRLDGGTLEDAVFSNSDCRGVAWNSDLSKASFTNCDLRQAAALPASWWGVNIVDCDMRELDFTGRELVRTSLIGCDARNMQLASCSVGDAMLSRNDFRGADFRDAAVRGCMITDCDLRGCQIARCVFAGSSLVVCKIATVTSSGETAKIEVDLTSAHLQEASLIKLDLRGANFADCDLSQVRLVECCCDGDQW